MKKQTFKRSMPPTDAIAREVWLLQALNGMRPLFSDAGYQIPERVRVSCGLPSVKAFGKTKRRIGECWSSKNSKDQHFEIFVSPTIDDSMNSAYREIEDHRGLAATPAFNDVRIGAG